MTKREWVWEQVRKLVVVIIGAVLGAIALNWFLKPANVYASGFTGVAQLVSNIITQYSPMHVTTGFLLLLFNIPVAILGWMKVGKSFTFYSFLSVVFTSFFLEIIPIHDSTHDILLYSVFGGIIAAIGVGITLKFGASTGGLDIIVMVLSRIMDRPVGSYFFVMNGVIIITAGALYGWDKALYTLVSLYASTRVIDAIHTRYQKLTVMIITKKSDEMKKAIHAKLTRGITELPAKGAFSNEEKNMLMIVITRYELYDLEKVIKDIDDQAFTNIVQTTNVFGFFRKD